MKTRSMKASEVNRRWYVLDLDGLTVGRAAARVAAILRGKHRPTYTPHVDTGDFVIAVNADKVVFSGRKLVQKMYYRHSGFPGGLRQMSALEMMRRKPTDVFRLAVQGMLPRCPLGRRMLRKLKIYQTEKHPHQAQQPEPLQL